MSDLLKVLLILIICTSPACAVQRGHVDYDGLPLDYSKIDERSIMQQASKYMLMWQSTENKQEKQEYIRQALGAYYLLTKIDASKIHPYVSIARMYDELNKYTMAKEYFYRATNLNAHDAEANFYFGEFYFRRDDYRRALVYYLTAYENGYANNYKLNLRLAVIYEKLADIKLAEKFYQSAYRLNPNDEKLAEKIRSLDDLNYDDTQYYLFGGE